MSYVNYDKKYWERKREQAEKARRAQDPKKVIMTEKDLDRLCKSFTPEQRRMQDFMLRSHERYKREFGSPPSVFDSAATEPPVNDVWDEIRDSVGVIRRKPSYKFDSDAFDRDILRSRGERNVRRTCTHKECVSEDPIVYKSVAMTPDGETRCIEMRGHVPIPLPELKKMAP